ncbi:TPA: tetratricopeptide repeat protein [Vibrio cholerae]|uniref:MSHA biogenesis protein MshN n=6 Tax=Vibrio cholerae TaxID=666 RepID=Q9KUV8_VIBCH|nr:MSHA biogenesis protein MshN [Vibrio cholerae O1 biovar El Tor str. N16961]ABQ19983.1 MSHA biogenesis protein MshN [Vibrio cholerae O395]ACP04715.1 MSHA biogenesis protein MshN [Vibrio cholerae M66-2]ACQ59392.1 MSHA biogenesis protein MshN [Vibrio cholerae MJ-1236]ARB81862.1 MSHA biogenesis protein MshN [Vibrio cholerae]AVH53251.1 MSHA biogenesis protein MshN [Vibrio cholerae O1 biovar El Tor]EAZ73805.1 MSHA biogenesis protein MshN [Vibrio cholerae NCTC 8457]EAZ77435.1 MSHA biogenesis pro
MGMEQTMSVVNEALAKSAQRSHSRLSNIERIDVAKPKARPAWLWVMLGFGVSLAVGGWSISLQSVDTIPSSAEVVRPEVPSPTQKTTQQSIALYQAPVNSEALVKNETLVQKETLPKNETSVKNAVLAKVEGSPTSLKQTANRQREQTALGSELNAEPVLNLVDNSEPSFFEEEVSSLPSSSPVMIVEQVSLTPEQLAQKALQRAQKAMESNELQTAVSAYTEALRYTPHDEMARQKLAALYYGKGDGRKAFDLMQAGIERNPDGEVLRLALAKLLVKEKQEASALVPLAYLPSQPSIEYLSLRAALAQKTKQDEIARESYQQLTEKDPNNGRWWLGLAIQQERALQWPAAQHAYQQALNKVGLSSQSQAFIHQRLQLLASLEETQSAN